MGEETKPNLSPKKPKKLWLIVLIIIVVLALIIGAFFLGKLLTGKSLKLVSESSPTPTLSLTPTPTITPKKSATPVPEDTVPAGKKIFRNEDYGYQVTYPEDATITYADEAGLSESGHKSNKVCVSIKNNYMFVTISAKENKDGQYICHRTGVGSDEVNNIPDQVTVLGKTYTASGFMFSSVSMKILNSDWMFNLDDGTGFEYGINLNPETYENPGEAKAHAEAKAIVESFKEL